MADRALSEEAMLAGLRDIRLPAEAAGGITGDVLAALALGLLLAMVLALALRLVTAARGGARPVAAEAMDPEDERLALLRRLKTQSPERYRALTARIYQPGGMPELEQLRREVQGHV